MSCRECEGISFGLPNIDQLGNHVLSLSFEALATTFVHFGVQGAGLTGQTRLRGGRRAEVPMLDPSGQWT